MGGRPRLGCARTVLRVEGVGTLGALSFVCAAVPLSPLPRPGPHSPDPGVAALRALCPILAPRTPAAPLPDSRAASVRRRVPRPRDPPSLAWNTLHFLGANTACVRPDSLGSGTLSPQDWGPSGLPSPSPIPGGGLAAKAGAPVGVEPSGRGRVGGGVASLLPTPSLLYRPNGGRGRPEGPTGRDRRGAPGRDDEGALSSQRVSAALVGGRRIRAGPGAAL